MLLYIYLRAFREEALLRGDKEAIEAHLGQKTAWLADTNILLAHVSDEHGSSALTLLASPCVASIELAREFDEAPHFHMVESDWERLRALRERSDLSKSERGELIGLLEKANAELARKAIAYVQGLFGDLAKTQINMLRQLEGMISVRETS